MTLALKIFLHFFLILFSKAAFSKDCNREFRKTLSRIADNDFSIGRSLTKGSWIKNKFYPTEYGYSQLLYRDFLKHLDNLTPYQSWLDSGAGEGRAILEYLQRKVSLHATVTALTFSGTSNKILRKKIESIVRSDPGRIQFLEGKMLSQYDHNDLQSYDLITDVFGPLSYVRDFSGTLRLYLQRLKPDGELYFVTDPIGFKVKSDEKMPSINIIQWLRKIPFLQVDYQVINFSLYSIRLKKLIDYVPVPELLVESSSYKDGVPPKRVYLSID